MGRPVDRSVPPSPGRLRPFHFPPFSRTRLGNGLTVLAARLPGVPLVSLELVVPAGGQFDPEGRAGLATLTASLVDEGTARRGAMEIASTVERLGGYLSTGADWDVAYLATGLLAPNLVAGFELLAEVATDPTFPEAEVERLRRQRLAELLRRGHDPSSLADDRLSRVVYDGTVYANPLVGSEESVAAIDRELVLGFYRRQYSLNGSALIAVGDFDPEELLREVEAALGGLDAGEAPPQPEVRPAPLSGITVQVLDRPGAAQTELRLGHLGVTRTDPDYIPLVVMNTILGGKFTSRINMNLRERHGYTYGASSRFVGRLGPGPFVAGAAVATESAGAAAREILAEIRLIRQELIEPAELEETQSYLAGVFPYTVQTIGDLAKRLEVLAVYGLPDDYFDRYIERLGTVTREEILDVAQRHLDPDHMAVVAVGPADVLLPQFEGIGPVTVSSPHTEATEAQFAPS